MQLENEIGIRIRNEWQRSSLNLLYTYGFLINGYETFFKHFGLTSQQYNSLRILHEEYPEPISTSGLRDKMLDKMSDTSRLVSRLAAKGFVEVKQNPHDKRLVNIVLSEQGQKRLTEIEQHLSLLDSLMENLTEEEASQLSHLLNKARKSIVAVGKKLKNNVIPTEVN
jgi:DNA-binding MarR family transcriptional regulator